MNTSSSENTATGDKPCAAISLLDKYSSLNTSIDKNRKELSATLAKLDTKRQQIYNLVNIEREKMKKETQQAKDEMEELKKKKREERNRFEKKAIMHHDAAVQERDEATKKLRDARQFAEERRRSFLESCQNFRLDCLRLRINVRSGDGNDFCCSNLSLSNGETEDYLSSSSSDDEDASINNYIEMEKDSGSDGLNIFLDDSGKEEQIDHIPRKKRTSSHRKSRKVDQEMQETKQKKRISIQAQKDAQNGLNDAIVDLENARKRTRDRKQKLAQGRAQLERIRRDVEEMENEIKSLDQETLEARSLGEAFANDACRRKRTFNSRSNIGATYNNYNRPENTNNNNSITTPSLSTSRASTHSTDVGSVTPSPNSSSNNNGWANHHIEHNSSIPEFRGVASSQSRYSTLNNPYAKNSTKRVNVSHLNTNAHGAKNMSSSSNSSNGSMLIQDDNDDDDNFHNRKHKKRSLQRQHPHRAGRIRVNRQFTTALEVTSGREADEKDETSVMAGVEGPMATTCNDSGDLCQEDVDEDDDDLLSYVAFQNSRHN